MSLNGIDSMKYILVLSSIPLIFIYVLMIFYISKMLLKTSLGSAYVHNIDLIDKSKEIILFIPGAGMDHRVADLLHPDPKIFNQVISIDLPGHGGSPFKRFND